MPARADVVQAKDPPPHASLNEKVVRIPGGDAPPPVTLQVTIMHPDGNGPFPLAIMNHGATAASMGHRGERVRLSNGAFYFLSRGYAVALPMMRGFAASGGGLFHFGCDLAAVGTANAKDIRAVISYLGNDPRFDTRRVIVAGQSMGGWNALALGALGPPNVAGLVNFNGGIRMSDCKSGDSNLIAGAEAFGRQTKIPSIWFYGENDALFSVPLWRAMYDRYTRAGASAELVDVGVVMQDSHNFLAYPEPLPAWTGRVDRFLARIGMPHAAVNPGDLPMTFPPPTRFAGIADVAAVPFVSDKARELYRKYLELPFPRAFVISENGGAASMTAGFDPLGQAFAACEQSGFRCGAYAVDDHVVWTPFPSAAQERSYHIGLKADQPALVDFAVRLNPDCTAKAFADFQVVEAPRHGWIDIERKSGLPNYPQASPFAKCNRVTANGVAVTYIPARGFAGGDSFSFAETMESGARLVFKMSVSVN